MSGLEDTLAFQIKAAGLPEPKREYQAIAGRKFRFDFAWPLPSWDALLVEVQGGIWKPGGHSTGKGITRDCEKLCLATLAGWRCLQVTKEHIESGQALKWIQEALKYQA